MVPYAVVHGEAPHSDDLSEVVRVRVHGVEGLRAGRTEFGCGVGILLGVVRPQPVRGLHNSAQDILLGVDGAEGPSINDVRNKGKGVGPK